MNHLYKPILFACLFFCLNRSANAQHVYAYITNSGSDNMSIIDLASNTVIGTVSLGAGTAPFAVTVLPNGNAYIADNGNGTVTVFSTTGNNIIGTIPVGSGPLSIAASPDATKVYVTNTNDGTVSVIGTATNIVLATITIGGNPTGVVVSPDNSTVYVADGIAGVAVINAATNTVTATIPTGASSLPKGVAITPDGQFLYVAKSNAGQIGVYSTTAPTYTNVANVAVSGGPFGITVSPDGSTVYATSSGSHTVAVISTATNTFAAPEIAVGGGNNPIGISVSPDGTTAYVVNFGANSVSMINTATASLTGSPIVVGSNPTSFSNFIASVPFILPVHFTSFTAKELSNHSIQLNWKVQDQTDGTYYEVLSSKDGISFSTRATISSDPHANAAYSWTDVSASLGTNFYRIKSVETSGMINYSQILRLTVGSNATQMMVYPNPVKDKTFTLQLSNQPAGLYTVEVVNLAGQRVFTTQVNYTGGATAQTVSLPQGVSMGLYQVLIKNGSTQKAVKLIVE
jgi:YVTN family beta-propeller protein